MPHADDWGYLKYSCILQSKDSDPAISTEVAELEAVVISDGRKGHQERGVSDVSSVLSSIAPAPPEPSPKAGSRELQLLRREESWQLAHSALLKMRAELLRQAGVVRNWRTGHISAVISSGSDTLTHRRSKRVNQQPLIEVRMTWSSLMRLYSGQGYRISMGAGPITPLFDLTIDEPRLIVILPMVDRSETSSGMRTFTPVRSFTTYR